MVPRSPKSGAIVNANMSWDAWDSVLPRLELYGEKATLCIDEEDPNAGPNLFGGDKVNPLIGSAGVSAVPMAARVSQVEGAKADPTNFLLMHAMGPNVAGVIGTALVAGYFIATIGNK